jgi:hypothetical protein
MPFHYERDDTRRRITVSLSDPFSEAEGWSILDRQLAEGTWRYGLLYETRQLREPLKLAVSRVFIARVAALAAEHGPRGPVGIVAREATAVAAGEAYARVSELSGLTVEVFWSIEEAEDWLEAQNRLRP